MATNKGGSVLPSGRNGRTATAPGARRPSTMAAKIPAAPVVRKMAVQPADDAVTADAPAVAATITRDAVPDLPEVSPPMVDASAAQNVTESVAGVIAGAVKTPAEVTRKMESVMKTAEEFVSFGQGNVEAFMKASQIWAAGVQDLGKQFAATAQAQFDESVSVFKALSGVKSLKEAIDLQSNLARTSMEKAVAETGKMTDASMKLAEQTFAPITARVTLAVEKFGRTA